MEKLGSNLSSCYSPLSPDNCFSLFLPTFGSLLLALAHKLLRFCCLHEEREGEGEGRGGNELGERDETGRGGAGKAIMLSV